MCWDTSLQLQNFPQNILFLCLGTTEESELKQEDVRICLQREADYQKT